MSTLRQAAQDYLGLRRSLGFALGVPGRMVEQFAGHLDSLGATHVTTDLAVAWATAPAEAAPYYHWLRLNAVRGFARYLHGIDAAHQIPPANVLPRNYHRRTPHLLSTADVAALAGAAAALKPPLHAATYQTLIGLLAIGGTRPKEAISLDISDVRLPDGVITVHGKYGKTREILLHPSTIEVLTRYAQLVKHSFRHRDGTSFFVSTIGTPLNQRRVNYVFTRLAQQAGLHPRSQHCRVTPMSLRHSFAVNTLITWYQAGVDVDAHLPLLSTWLGHVYPADTYWYLSAAPELLALAAERMTHLYNTPKDKP